VAVAVLASWCVGPGGPGPSRAQAQGHPDPIESGAAAPEPLSLSDAVLLARENSPVIRESEANRDAARAARREARLQRLPSITLRETAVRTDSPADAFGLQLMQERFSFPAFTQSDPNDPEAIDNFTTEVEVRMPLFTGGALSGGIRQAGRMADAAEALRAHTASAVELGVTEAYLGVLLAGRFQELAEKARATAARHVEQAQAFFDTGMIVESDLLQARVQLARMDENLVRARNGERLARAGLNRAMGLDQGREFTLTDGFRAGEAPAGTAAGEQAGVEEAVGLPGSAMPLPASFAQALERARAGRQDLRASDQRVEAMRAGIGRARGEYFPQIGLAARWDWNDDRAFGDSGDSYMLIASAEWNVWNWGQTRARVTRSKSEYSAAVEARRAYRDQVEFEVRQAWQGLEEARARRAVTSGAVGAAERALTILEDRFAQGVARVTDVIDAETMAHEARVRDAQASYDVQRTMRALAFAIGEDPVPEVMR
jgi:outer membrane protein TolC